MEAPASNRVALGSMFEARMQAYIDWKLILLDLLAGQY